MTTLSIDIETYSGTSLKDAGVYKYVEDPDFEILLFAYSFDGGEVKVLDLKSTVTDFSSNRWAAIQNVRKALVDPTILKTAHNANFEITCISKYFGIELDPAQWQCTMVLAAIAGLPLSLGEVSKVLNLEEQKDTKGKALLNYFSKPCKPTKANGERTRNLPQHSPEKWAELIEYCRQDVVTEMAVKDKLAFVKVTEKEKALWVLDQQINDRGVGVEMQLVENAIKLDDINRARLVDEASELTGLDNPNSVAQIKQWLQDMMECDEIKSLNKEAVNKLIKSNEDPDIHDLLKLRQEMGKTSVKKYTKIQGSVCENGRVKGLLQYYGANRTGRWCLAEGSPVLVLDPKGEVYEKPIEDVELTDLVFDGVEWVAHEGVVFSGDKGVIAWDGIVASPAHVVFLSDTEKTTLQEAKQNKQLIWRGNTQYTSSHRPLVEFM